MLLITFNQEQTILEALEGAVSQDYPNTEIIICDDASQDSTFEKIIEFSEIILGHTNSSTTRIQKM